TVVWRASTTQTRRCRSPACSGRARLSKVGLAVANGDDLVASQAAGRLHLGGITFALADQGAGDRRIHRDLALLDVGLVVADDLVRAALAAVEVLYLDGRAENDPSFGIEVGGIDHLRVRELRLEIRDAPFDEALPLLRRVVVRVLRQIAVRA